MSVDWKIDLDFARLRLTSGDVEDALADGAAVVFAESESLVPKRSGVLSDRGGVRKDRGGNNTVAIVYDGPYARWVHEHVHFKHPFGGQAKFLESAMYDKDAEAYQTVAEAIRRKLKL